MIDMNNYPTPEANARLESNRGLLCGGVNIDLARRLEREKAALREALEKAEEYMQANIPANYYGLRDHAADKEREEVVAIIRETLTATKPKP